MVFGEGSWAEYVTASAAIAQPDPGRRLVRAGRRDPAVPGGTAIALLDTADISTGDTVAIVGAAGGSGSYAVQLAAMVGVARDRGDARSVDGLRPGPRRDEVMDSVAATSSPLDPGTGVRTASTP